MQQSSEVQYPPLPLIQTWALESTAMLLRCQASIKSIDGADVKLVVSDMWMAMIQTKESTFLAIQY